jgi:hypothetical protein
MINLLPADYLRQLRAARTNVLLLRYSIGLILVAISLALATLAVFMLLGSLKTAAQNTIASNQAKVGNFTSVQSQADAYRQDLSDAKLLLDNEILYSKIYLEIARIMPAGTALQSLDLNPSNIGTPLSLPVKIVGERQATSLLSAFRSSAIFSKSASYGALTPNMGTDSTAYPYIITINVTIDKGAIK